MTSIKNAIELKHELDLLRPLNEEDELRIMQKFRLDWNYHSNNLEGNSLTHGETRALILFGITAQGKPLKDHFEITGHDEAIKWIMEIVKEERPITENFIRELHKLILKEPYDVDAITAEGKPTKKRVNIGVYKSSPNHVKTKTGEIFRFASPEETPAKMSDLISWYKSVTENQNINPILVASEFHYKYIRIHPFDDGNGRTARILMNFILMRYGYPPVIIKTEDKQSYFAALQQADTGVLEPFVEYISKNLNDSLRLMIKGAKGESVEDPDDLDKEIALLENKINSVTQPINFPKNKENILNLYNNSLSQLITKFIEKSELFEKFYVNHRFYFYMNNTPTIKTKAEAVSIGREIINENVQSIYLEFKYENFDRIEFIDFNYDSRIEIAFEYTHYIVKTLDGFSYEKLYGEELTKEEILELVSSEIKRHKRAIEKIIEKNK